MDTVLLLELNELPHLRQQAAAQGIEARIVDVEAFARRNRRLLLRDTASGMDIDIALGIAPSESNRVKRSQRVAIGDLALGLPTPEDLIILKAVAHRPQDLLNIEGVIANRADLDEGRIGFWVKQSATGLEMPELWDDLEAQLSSRRVAKGPPGDLRGGRRGAVRCRAVRPHLMV